MLSLIKSGLLIKTKEMKNYLTLEEVANKIRLSKSTVYKRTFSRSIPHFKMGNKLLFDEDAIDKWLNDYRKDTLEQQKSEVDKHFEQLKRKVK